MTEVNYQSTTLVNADTEHLKILTICWYVLSGLLALFGFFPFIHLIIGVMMLTSPKSFGPGDPALPIIGTMFVVMASIFILMMWTISILAFMTARSLARRRRRMFCFVCAIVACLQIPLGTLLGVFTLIVLSRPSVQNMFSTTDKVGPA